jgi:NAD+ synthase (glutamine-hydrolysing)
LSRCGGRLRANSIAGRKIDAKVPRCEGANWAYLSLVPRLAISQFRPAKGEYAANVRRIADVIAQAATLDGRPDLVVFPETATSGYFVEGGVQELAVTAGTLARDLAALYSGPPIDVAVGFYELFQNHFFNSCLYVTLGGKQPAVRHVHRKVFLPTYGVFDEERFVDRGQDGVRAFDTAWGRVAILICEDAWHSLAATIAALDGAQVILVPSASPARGSGVDEAGAKLPASMVRWERVVQGIAEEHGVFVVLANLVGFEGGKGFPGASAVFDPAGELLVRGPLFEEALVTCDLNFDRITHARADSPLLSDLQNAVPILIKGLGKGEGGRGKSAVKFDAATNGTPATPHPAPRTPVPHVVRRAAGDEDPLRIDVRLAEQWLVAFLKDEVVKRRGFTKGIVGISGGVDSALTACLAVQALGKANVIGVRMPYRTSSPESLTHAQRVIDQLGIASVTVDITAAVDGYLQNFPEADATRRGNVMARERMIVLFDLSAKHRALPLGTGNKSERLLGYFTWHADDTPPVNPLGDLFKTQVWALARHVGVPEDILSKPATPDLVPGQETEKDYGFSYLQADPILYYLIRGLRPEEIVARGFPADAVEGVRARLDATHWKRRLPTVAVMSQTAIGEFYLRPVDY